MTDEVQWLYTWLANTERHYDVIQTLNDVDDFRSYVESIIHMPNDDTDLYYADRAELYLLDDAAWQDLYDSLV